MQQSCMKRTRTEPDVQSRREEQHITRRAPDEHVLDECKRDGGGQLLAAAVRAAQNIQIRGKHSLRYCAHQILTAITYTTRHLMYTILAFLGVNHSVTSLCEAILNSASGCVNCKVNIGECRKLCSVYKVSNK